MTSEVITTLATIPAILALVQLAKTFGVQGKWNTLLAVVLGLVLQLGDAAFISGATTPTDWYQAGAAGLILGLSAAGLYDTAKTASTTTHTVVEALPVDKDVAISDDLLMEDEKEAE